MKEEFANPVIIVALVAAVGIAVYAARMSHQSQELAKSILAKSKIRQAANKPATPARVNPPVAQNPATAYTTNRKVPSTADVRVAKVIETFGQSWGLSFQMPPDGKGNLRTDFGGKMQITTITFSSGLDLALHIYAYSGNASKAEVMTFLYEESNIVEKKWNQERSPFSLVKKGFSEEILFTGKAVRDQVRYEVVYAKNKTGRFQYLFMWETSDDSFSQHSGVMRSFYESLRGQR